MGRAWPVRKADLTIRWQLGLHEVYHHGFSLFFGLDDDICRGVQHISAEPGRLQRQTLLLALRCFLLCWVQCRSSLTPQWVFGHSLSVISLVASVYYCHFGTRTTLVSELPLAGFRDDP